MAHRIPGPLCRYRQHEPIDSGTMCLQSSPLPGPCGKNKLKENLPSKNYGNTGDSSSSTIYTHNGWLSVTRKKMTPREKEIQALIDKDDMQGAIDKTITLYQINTSAVSGKPTFNPKIVGATAATDIISREVIVGMDAFRSPGWLASHIRHETFHAEDYEDYWHIEDQVAKDMLHIRVYDKQLSFAGQDGLTDDEIKEIRKKRLKYYNRLSKKHREDVDKGNYAIPR